MTLLWKPLLAATLPADADLGALPYPLWGSPKIDGYRCMVQNGVAVTRKGIKIRNTAVQEIIGREEYEALDGELVVGKPWAPDVFNRTQNCVNSGQPEDAETFRKHGCLWIIDKYTTYDFANGGLRVSDFETRQEDLHEDGALAQHHSSGYVQIIDQTWIKNAKKLLSFEARCLKKGYEGAMLRCAERSGEYPQKPGKENRSTLREFWLVKMKRFDYGEARIITPRYLVHNQNEARTATGARRSAKAGKVTSETQVGKVDVVEIKTKALFSLTVSTNELRDKGFDWWQHQVGKVIRYKHQVRGALNAPRICTATFEELL